MILTKEYLEKWIGNFKKAWMEKNLDEVANIFSKIKNYYETKDSLPVKTVDEVLNFWKEIKDQTIKALNFKINFIKNNECEIEWIFEDQSGKYEGVYKIIFDENLNCIEFRQWLAEK